MGTGPVAARAPASGLEWRRNGQTPTAPRAEAAVAEGAPAERRAVPPAQEAGPRPEPSHGVRGGALPEPGRVLGARHRDADAPRRHVYARVRVLRREDGPTGRRGPGRARA